MKLDSNTVKVLKNFSSINSSIMIKEGNVVRTISPSKTVMAKATLTQDFPKTFAIHDVSRFLGTVSLTDDADLNFGDKSVSISHGKQSCNYGYTDASLIVVAPEKDINLDGAEVSFRLTEEDLATVHRALGVLSLPEIAVVGKGGKMFLQAVDTKGTTNDVFSVELGDTTSTFRMVFRSENIKLMAGDYDVKISAKGLSHFKGDGIEYWVAVESNSTFEG